LAAAVLTLALTIIVAGICWLVLGNRLQLDAQDARQNELLNLLVYAAIVLPFAFLIVFFVVEKL